MHALRYRVSCNEIPERKKKKKKKSRLTIQIFKNNLLNFITASNVVKVDRRYLLNKKQAYSLIQRSLPLVFYRYWMSKFKQDKDPKERRKRKERERVTS